ncbi:glycosyl hydrolase 5 family protein-like [Tasmannia lanceolata]|uniref:glycosyl hydrolase 5 family protein-like n=1 Tax=Tasmannia lanceolata TaxID=3420 RepID=UPI0040638DCD
MRLSLLLPFVLLSLNFLSLWPSMALPLSTNSRWIVDENGRRVKLACMSWASHLEVMLAEGLNRKPLDTISKKIVSMGFNCVRLTWPLFMVTNDSLASLTVRQSFLNNGLTESIAAIQVNNPSLIDLPLIQAYQAVVSSLSNNNVMVILDNHISKPGWCCSNSDNNGFFGDKYFDPNLWLTGLTRIATMFNGSSYVVGMSLRNELRGPKQNLNDWYKYMQKGAEAVHAANPNILVILSGLNFDTELSFLSNKQVQLTFTEKLVFELHWYAFSDGQAWAEGNPNQVCGSLGGNFKRRGGFLLEQGFPLFLSEFGVDERGTNVNDNRFLNCMFGVAADLDLDWSLWALQGSYYLREGVKGMDETYGILGWDWCGPRNSSFLERISALQSPFQGPGVSEVAQYNMVFHPSTGLCMVRKSLFEPLQLGSCVGSDHWTYTPQKTLNLKGTFICLQADGSGKAAKLGIICNDSSSKWEPMSDSKMHLSSTLANGSTVCLDVDMNNSIITGPCKCLSRDQSCDPANQWFKIINSTRDEVTRELSLKTFPLVLST